MRATIGSMLYGFHILAHPFEGFWDLKHVKKNTFSASGIILLCVMLSVVLKIQASGFLFRTGAAEDINLIMELLTVLLPLGLWVCVNWSITTLFDGKASMKVIFISTVYALLPLALIFIPQVILSRFFTLDEKAFYVVMDVIAAVWTVFLLLTGSAAVQDYTMFKTIVSAFCTLIGIVAVLFLLSVLYSALSQLIGFFTTILMELRFW